VTEVDSLWMVLEEFGDREIFEAAENGLQNGMTLREVMDLEFTTMSAPLDEVVAWMLEHVRVRPGFREFAEAHDPLILSSSFVETIEPLLEREGVSLHVVANRIEPRPDGWRIRWRDEALCAHCDEACKRASLPAEAPVVFVGDGYSDRCAALAADRVFARDGLAAFLEAKGRDFEPFTDFVALARALRDDRSPEVG
jgi:2-hydroxy-3-keto-5-methylthiopentenyl-1-phosphate phosphatase